MSRIRVGTSGWSYPSGKGTWNGIFYPEKRKGFDELQFYAEHFDTVEVNSTFYRLPAVKTTKDWAARTPRDFEFSLKLYQKFTHPEMFLKATGRDPADIDRTDVDEFRAAIDPLAAAGKLGPLLAQFPASFKNEPASMGYLDWLLDAFEGYQLAIELRQPLAAERNMRVTLDRTEQLLAAPPQFGLLFSSMGRGPAFYGGVDRDLQRVLRLTEEGYETQNKILELNRRNPMIVNLGNMVEHKNDDARKTPTCTFPIE